MESIQGGHVPLMPRKTIAYTKYYQTKKKNYEITKIPTIGQKDARRWGPGAKLNEN